ncbi:MAG TPA: hypothetical protein PK802_04960 [Candidatus Cloacimonadota bacterium]|nr:hypothetical protein [Candidatus Cloacimonadota bacterium]HQP18001.1 hypothetical protein [Candidatus Cloacimonadota bacterium]
MPDLTFRLILTTTDASQKLAEVKQEAESAQSVVEKPATVKITAEQALATIRDVKIAVDGVLQVVGGLARSMNGLLDASLGQRQAMTLAAVAFGEAAEEMGNFASSMQQVTNFEDDQLLSLMSKLSQTFKLNKDEIQQLVPLLLDFTEANKATGMSVESAFDLMGRALNGHTAMLGRYGIVLDDTRLKTEGVSYLVEKLGEDYGGTAEALADLRLQNANAWGDIQETVGDMLTTLINPLLRGLRLLMDAYDSLSPVMKGFVTGIVIAIPIIGTVTTAITALTAAYHALQVAMNPVAGIIGIVVGALSALGFGLAAASMKTDEVSTAQRSMKDEIKDAERQVSVEAEKFSLLATRLLELRSASSLTVADKRELKNVIKSLNDNYSEYLGNINLETAAYNNLATALRAASEALMQKKVAEIYGEKYNAQVRRVAELQIELDNKRAEYETARNRMNQLKASVDWEFLTSDRNAMGFNPASYFGNDGEWLKLERTVNTFGALSGKLQAAKYDLQALGDAYRKAVLEVSDFTFDQGSGGGGGSTPAPVPSPAASEAESRRREALRLMEELARLRQTETDRIEAEYQRRLALIREFTQDGSDAERQAIENLDAWKTQQDNELITKEKDAVQARYKAEIDYFSNLESLGVSSYDALKVSMEEYYAWAQQNLPEKEQQLIQAQIAGADTRHAKLLQERQDEEQAKLQELQDIRDEFHSRDLDNVGDSYGKQLLEVDKYYEKMKAKLLEAGLTEVEIERQKQETLATLRTNYQLQAASGISKIFGDIASAQDKDTERGFKLWKASAIAQGYVDTFSAAIGAYKSMVGIPVVGPGLAVAAAAAAMTAGIANIAKISSTKFEKKATGGLLNGPSHAQGGILIEAEGEEYITAKDRVKALGRNLFDFLNFAPLDQVKLAFASMPVPSVPIPNNLGESYAAGGAISKSGSMNTLIDLIAALKDEIVSLRQTVMDSKPIIEVNVDPLSNDPVKVSEIAETGKIIRSEI